jgi:replicative DNA helicase
MSGAHEAEAAVLAAVMLRNEAFDVEAVAELQPDDFNAPKHRAVWAAMRTLLHAGSPVDVITLEQQLRDDETLSLVGGLEGVTSVSDRFASTHNVGRHAAIVAAKSRARRARQLLVEAAEYIEGASEVDEVDSRLDEVLAAVSDVQSGTTDGLVSMGQIVDAALHDARARHDGTLQPYSWGLSELDDRFDGGMIGPQLVVLAARPGMGKTALAMCVAFASAKRGETPLVFSLEMSPAQLGRRAATSLGAIDMRAAKKPTTDNAWGHLIAAREHFAKLGGKVWPRPIHLDRMLAVTRSWARRTKKPGPIVVDYLQLVDLVRKGIFGTSERVSTITRELKKLAMEVGVPVLLLSQLNRKVEDRDDKRPRLADLRDSGSIEQDADAVVFLFRPRVYDSDADPMEAEAIVAKLREGETGTAHVRFEGHFSRFVDVEPAAHL